MAVCLAIWISLCSVGQDFYSFQWDILLCEAGFLAIFANQAKIRIWLFRWLLFRLMFFSGAVKLLSADVAWRGFTALTYHYYTQPLPTPLAWYLQQAPGWFQAVSVGFLFLVELVAPFLFFAPRRFRHIAAWLTIALQVLILLTGNYTFFNFLTIALCMWLFIEPDPNLRSYKAVTIGVTVVIGVLSSLICLQLFDAPMPPGGNAILRAADPFRIVNSYGLFAIMTTSPDGNHCGRL